MSTVINIVYKWEFGCASSDGGNAMIMVGGVGSSDDGEWWWCQPLWWWRWWVVEVVMVSGDGDDGGGQWWQGKGIWRWHVVVFMYILSYKLSLKLENWRFQILFFFFHAEILFLFYLFFIVYPNKRIDVCLFINSDFCSNSNFISVI